MPTDAIVTALFLTWALSQSYSPLSVLMENVK
jgi:hypothetical protein